MSLDTEILLWINGHHAHWLDVLMWFVSQTSTWLPLYVLMAAFIVWRYRNWKTVLLILVGFGVAVGLSDFTTSGIIKPLVCRLRPTHEPSLDPLHLVRGYCGGRFGFCSSHAANTMTCALLFSLVFRNKIATTGLMVWVALVAYSRMYLGVHYPSDIIVGWAVGSLWAVVVWLVLRNRLRAGDEAAPPGGS